MLDAHSTEHDGTGAWADGDGKFGGGEGSVKKPYIINDAEHWNQLVSDVNSGNYQPHHRLLFHGR